jgi:hypothetical protein
MMEAENAPGDTTSLKQRMKFWNEKALKMKKNEIILSTASVASALSALGYLGTQDVTFDAETHETRFSQAVSHAISGSVAQQEIRAAMPSIAEVVRLDGELLSEEYIRVADYRNNRHPLDADSTIDMTSSGTNSNPGNFSCYTNCHSACHSACHGSRGWR